MSEKIYIGKGKEVGNYGNMGVTLDLDGLGEIYRQHGFKNQQGAKKLKIIMAEMKNPDDYGNTHTVYINTWKPEQQQSSGSSVHEDNDIPF